MIHLLSYIVKEILESSQSMFSLNNDSWKNGLFSSFDHYLCSGFIEKQWRLNNTFREYISTFTFTLLQT